MRCSLFPQSPLLWKGCLFWENPPRGPLSLKVHKKLLASLKWSPTVEISWIRSSTDEIPYFPKLPSTSLLLVSGILWWLILPYPLFRTNFLMVSTEGYPKVMYGSTLLRRFTVALLILTKAPLWICLNLRSLKILTDLGSSLLTPLILITKATLGWAGTWICPLCLAALRAATPWDTYCCYSAVYCWILFNKASLFVLFSVLLFSLCYLRVVAILLFLCYFLRSPSGLGGTLFSACIIHKKNKNIEY